MHKWPPAKGDLGEQEIKHKQLWFCRAWSCTSLRASGCLKCQPTAKREKRMKSKLGKKIQVIPLVLQSPLCASGREGQSLSIQQSAPTPLFLDFNALEKALISWVQYFKIETQTSFGMNIKKSIKYFDVYEIGWTHWEGVSACPLQDTSWPIRSELVWCLTVDWNATHLILS